jgi:hypothetical protein
LLIASFIASKTPIIEWERTMILSLLAITIALLLSAAVAAAAQRGPAQHCGPRPFAALHLDI